VHSFLKAGSTAAALILAAPPVSAATAAPAPVPAPTRVTTCQSVSDFYRARNGALLWLAPNAGDAAQQLLATLGNARVDGLDPGRYGLTALQDELRKAWGGNKKAAVHADEMLSEAFVAYVRDMKQGPDVGVMYVDALLRPTPPSPMATLLEAAMAPSLSAYAKNVGWMNPIYGELRQALLGHSYASDHERQLLMVNLERARTLPSGKGRFVLVNAAQQRLFMWENGKAIDSMRVVVG
jgi:murein L,D-transpeptidase YcbB/YkuD